MAVKAFNEISWDSSLDSFVAIFCHRLSVLIPPLLCWCHEDNAILETFWFQSKVARSWDWHEVCRATVYCVKHSMHLASLCWQDDSVAQLQAFSIITILEVCCDQTRHARSCWPRSRAAHTQIHPSRAAHTQIQHRYTDTHTQRHTSRAHTQIISSHTASEFSLLWARIRRILTRNYWYPLRRFSWYLVGQQHMSNLSDAALTLANDISSHRILPPQSQLPLSSMKPLTCTDSTQCQWIPLVKCS